MSESCLLGEDWPTEGKKKPPVLDKEAQPAHGLIGTSGNREIESIHGFPSYSGLRTPSTTGLLPARG